MRNNALYYEMPSIYEIDVEILFIIRFHLYFIFLLLQRETGLVPDEVS